LFLLRISNTSFQLFFIFLIIIKFQEGWKGLAINIIISFLIALPSVSLAIFIPNIQSLMKYFSSTFGFLLMIVIPIGLIYKFRLRIASSQLRQGKLNKSFVNKNWQLILLLFIGLAIFSTLIVGFFNKNNKDCVYDK